ncbi:AT-rich interactive domain-containing protein 2-like [Culex pipiens pallens]|uniref:AT-rich interactive domain-containing protein 2-like n=1 Tax=Culex pipiens pallens TaxID=42434 RepID=UPI0019535A60|nr:AT-rich interactive domain-containing protein 2-like [Culex pipiens pallens]
MRGRNVDSHRLYWVVVARDWWLKVNSREDWGEIIEEMALPKRCVNNEIALKKINFRFLDKYAKVYFHEGPPMKRMTTKSYIIGGGQRRCCTRCRRFTAPQLPAHKHSRRDGAASAE